jgi:CheY-like chemotaxis protein
MLNIVVIEEDSAMRMLICEWLRGEGYRVLGLSANGAAHVADTDLVIVDVPNFRAQGTGAVQAVRAAYPHSALIGMSTQLGRSLPSDSDPARALGLRRLLAKPCARGELLDAVADAMSPARRAGTQT